jgi:hypothetical protein
VSFDEIASLDDKAAWRLTFPADIPYGARAGHRNWRPWTKPKENLPIDDFIEGLIPNGSKQYGRIAALKSQSELASSPLPIVCPYYHVRHSIWTATRRGNMWVQLVDEHRKELALRKAKQKETSNLAKSIKSYLEEGIDPRVLNPIPLYTDRQNPDDARKRAKQFHQLQSALQSAYSGLQDHANQIEADCERIPVHGNIRHNAWKAAFASQLGYCWTSLTGKQPSLSSSKSSKDFRTFVAQAFQSIGGNPAENWDRALRHILPRIGTASTDTKKIVGLPVPAS